jgi:hypothetical protein
VAAAGADVSFDATVGRGRGKGVRAGRVGTDPVTSGALASCWFGAIVLGAAGVRAVRLGGGDGSLRLGGGARYVGSVLATAGAPGT